MRVTIDASESGTENAPREWILQRAQEVLGRLTRRVSHAAVSVREQARTKGSRVVVCALRLRFPGSGDLLIESLEQDREAAITAAFRRARREILTRRKNTLRQAAWQPQPAGAA